MRELQSDGRQLFGNYFHCANLLFIAILLIANSARASIPDTAAKSIDSIIIDNRNIFNTDSSQYNNWIFRIANKLHLKTKRFVIKRELLQKKGEAFSRELADETERNLRALPYIWNADIELYRTDSGMNVMRVTTSDRWTISGLPSISRTSGKTVYELGIEESNFLGYGQYLEVNYRIRDFDENYAELSFIERRLFSSRHFLSVYYNDNPEIGLKSVFVGLPLYSLNSKFSYSAGFTRTDRVDKYYSGGVNIAQNKIDGSQLELSSLLQLGTYNSKVLAGINYIYKDIKSGERRGYGIKFPSDSIYHMIAPQFGLSHIRYHRTIRINGFKRVEDIPIINRGNISVGWAYDPIVDNIIYKSLLFSYDFSLHQGDNLLFLSFDRAYWYQGNIDFRNLLKFSIRYYNNGYSWITTVFYALYAEDQRDDRTKSIYLDENNGVRGYPEYYQEGEKIFRANLENRIFSKISFMSSDLGAVQFVDIGQVRSRDEGFKLRDMLWSVGIGLRIGTEKISDAEILRVDFAYAGKIRSWQVSFALGQYIK
jgi:outer membrane protein assembly factor BamA